METILAIVGGATLLYLFASVKIVRQGFQYTIEHFGRFTAVARPIRATWLRGSSFRISS